MQMELKEINIDQIVIKKRIREDLGDIDELARSINEYGLIIPIIISKKNHLISGLRRIKACEILGFTKIKAIILDIEEEVEFFNIEVQENLCRKPLTPEELDNEIEIKRKYATGQIKRKSVLGSIWRRVSSILEKSKNQR